MDSSAEQCARAILDVIPQVMQAIRSEIRNQRGHDLSVVQLRVLAFLRDFPGSPLWAVAEHIGVTAPSASSLIKALGERGLVERDQAERDRRFVTLRLTSLGVATLGNVRHKARTRLAERLSPLSETERAAIIDGMEALRSHFGGSTLPNP